MTPSEAQARLEVILSAAMRAPDPVAVIQRAANDPDLPPDIRRFLARVEPAGLRAARDEVLRLRRARLLAGSPEARARASADPEAFARALDRYHEEVAATAESSPEEAVLWARWARRAS